MVFRFNGAGRIYPPKAGKRNFTAPLRGTLLLNCIPLPSCLNNNCSVTKHILCNQLWVLGVFFAISSVLPTVPKIRLSCIFCTWFPLRRSEDRGHSIRWVVSHPVFDKSLW